MAAEGQEAGVTETVGSGSRRWREAGGAEQFHLTSVLLPSHARFLQLKWDFLVWKAAD